MHCHFSGGGKKLKPFVIFKGVKGRRSRIMREFADATRGYPQNMVNAVQEKAWNDTETMSQWIDQIRRPFCMEQTD